MQKLAPRVNGASSAQHNTLSVFAWDYAERDKAAR